MEYWNDGTAILGELTTISVMFRQQIPIIDYFLDMASLTLGGAGLELGAFELGWKYSSNASYNSSAYKIQRSLKDSGIRVSTKAIKSGITNGLKIAGKVTGYASLGITGADILVNQRVNPSNILDLAVTGVSFIPVIGWGISAGYLVANLIVFETSGQPIGNHLNDAIGKPLFKF